MGDMSPFRRSHEPGRPDHRPGAPEAEGRQREARTLDGSGGLDASLVRAGFYPDLVAHAIAVELEGRTPDAHLVHVDTHFDYEEIHRHITALVLAGDTLLAVHLDDHAADPAGQAVLAQVSTEMVPVRALGSVVLTTGHADPARFRPSDPVAEMTLGLLWAGGLQIQALAAGFNGAKSNKGEDAAKWLKANPVKTVMGEKAWDAKGDLKVSDYVVYQWDKDGKYHQLEKQK